MPERSEEHRKCRRVGIRWTGLFAHFTMPLVGMTAMLLVAASIMNSFAVMRVNENMAVLRQELRAMQTTLQAQQESGQQLQPKTLGLSSNAASPTP